MSKTEPQSKPFEVIDLADLPNGGARGKPKGELRLAVEAAMAYVDANPGQAAVVAVPQGLHKSRAVARVYSAITATGRVSRYATRRTDDQSVAIFLRKDAK